ncbi:MAG: thymidine phosphorylase [Chloroflexota bacterium]
MSIISLIERKRDGGALSPVELRELVDGFVRGEIPDYQVAAWLMAVCCRGMTDAETIALTVAMAESGRQMDLSGLGEQVVDKHSTGGVADTTSLIVVPAVAACGVRVAKMSGRGLGFSGGTLDKLESIPGFSIDVSPDRFVSQLEEVGAVIAGQSPDLAPADGRLYALRDVTGTVPSVPLIASSVMSKKLAGGAPAIVLDVKAGRGAFMKSVEDARQLAELMIRIGHAAGRKVSAFITSMDQPLGRAIGNASEIREAVSILRGEHPTSRLRALVDTIGGEMLRLAGVTGTAEEGARVVALTIASGAALEKLTALIEAQGGSAAAIEDTDILPRAPIQWAARATTEGWIHRVDPLALATAANSIGAGREKKGDSIDPAVGIDVLVEVGDRVEKGQDLATLHVRTMAQAGLIADSVESAFTVRPDRPTMPPLVHAKLTG